MKPEYLYDQNLKAWILCKCKHCIENSKKYNDMLDPCEDANDEPMDDE